MRVEASRTVSGVQSLSQVDMRDLAERMHAGIGAPGALRPRRASPQNADERLVSAPCTVGPSPWICQPTNGVPSYSIVSL